MGLALAWTWSRLAQCGIVVALFWAHRIWRRSLFLRQAFRLASRCFRLFFVSSSTLQGVLARTLLSIPLISGQRRIQHAEPDRFGFSLSHSVSQLPGCVSFPFIASHDHERRRLHHWCMCCVVLLRLSALLTFAALSLAIGAMNENEQAALDSAKFVPFRPLSCKSHRQESGRETGTKRVVRDKGEQTALLVLRTSQTVRCALCESRAVQKRDRGTERKAEAEAKKTDERGFSFRSQASRCPFGPRCPLLFMERSLVAPAAATRSSRLRQRSVRTSYCGVDASERGSSFKRWASISDPSYRGIPVKWRTAASALGPAIISCLLKNGAC